MKERRDHHLDHGLEEAVREVFAPGGLLASLLPGHEHRPDQERMALAVARTLARAEEDPDDASARVLVVEAGTGLGKTLAYLVPALLSGSKVAVSTATRNLQDQIMERDVPLLRQRLVPGLRAVRVKGRMNYLCLARYHQVRAAGAADLLDAPRQEALDAWIRSTDTGDRAELDHMPEDSPLWRAIRSQSETCQGQDCPHGAECFVNRLRREAAAARLLIVNHHLLFSDLAVRRGGHGEVLPRVQTVIVDEAHHVEDTATTFFGMSLSQAQCLDLARDVERAIAARHEIPLPRTARQARACLEAARALDAPLEALARAFPAEPGRHPLLDLPARPETARARDGLARALLGLAERLEALGDGPPWSALAARAQDLHHRLEAITAEAFDDLPGDEVRHVHWYERRPRTLSLHASPIDVREDLGETLFSQAASVIFTSATLNAGEDFSFFLSRLGLDPDTPCLALPSPFDYAGRVLIHVVENGFPEPRDRAWQAAACQRMEELVRASEGRALLLFTSYQAMRAAAAALEERLDYPLLVQGQAPRRRLLERFARETHSVLLAVSSFWEGVDVPGESLSLVVIDKLPFEVPSDPVIQARMARVEAAGGNPFMDFQVPRAVLGLRQGAGRLMRGARDRGVIAILDVRLFTKGYGRRFRRGLPPAPLCRDMDRVRAFFSPRQTGDQAVPQPG